MINTKVIRELNPCLDRFDNWLKHYGNSEVTYAQFLGLKNITQSDKLWVTFRLMNPELIRFAAADIAELVLGRFESKYPNDKRPRLAIEAARAIPLDKDKARAAAAYSAAYTAAYSAAATAAHYAAYSAADYAAYTAAYSAAYSVGPRSKTEKRIRTIVLKYLNKGKKK